jgi:fermentation-respiration switch protein FrsA (DUF1100 family)
LIRLGSAGFLVVAALAAYVAIAALVWVLQERLLFYPRPTTGPARAPEGWLLEQVSIDAGGVQLVGLLLKPPTLNPPVVMYFGGNAEEVTEYAHEAPSWYGPRAVLLVNYRGYGASGGRPGERDLVADGVRLFDWLKSRPDLDASRIAIHGRSLGTGVAVQVAAQRAVRCVVLTSPFDSARAVAQKIYWWLPVGMLMRHPFDSIAHAPRLSMPVLVLAGDADAIIPLAHSRRLAAAWGTPASLAELAGMGHNDIALHPRYAAEIRAFLDRHL